METQKPTGLEKKNELLKELAEMNRQIAEFSKEIEAYERSESTKSAFVATFDRYLSEVKFTGFPARSEEGYSKGEMVAAKRVLHYFSDRNLRNEGDHKKIWEGDMEKAKARKIVILEELHALGLSVPVASDVPLVARNELKVQESKGEPMGDAEELFNLQKQIERLQKEAATLTKRVAYSQKFPTPTSITVPEDEKSLPDHQDYPRILDIQAAITQAEADGKYLYATDTKVENDRRIKYLNYLLAHSPERKIVMEANEKAGANHLNSVSFSPDQNQFFRDLYEEEDQTIKLYAPSFRAKVSGSDRYDRTGISSEPRSDMEIVHYYKDMMDFIDGALAKQGEQSPESFAKIKDEFERLFPNYGKNTEK
jgi:hypothetical protein